MNNYQLEEWKERELEKCEEILEYPYLKNIQKEYIIIYKESLKR